MDIYSRARSFLTLIGLQVPTRVKEMSHSLLGFPAYPSFSLYICTRKEKKKKQQNNHKNKKRNPTIHLIREPPSTVHTSRCELENMLALFRRPLIPSSARPLSTVDCLLSFKRVADVFCGGFASSLCA